MKFYQENKVNPFGSCLPLVLQLPVFISLFYMLRKDLKLDICPGIATVRGAARHERHATSRCNQVDPDSRSSFHPGPHGKATGGVADRADRALRRLAAALELLMSVDGRPEPAADHASRCRSCSSPSSSSFPAGLLVYWITTNLWTIGQQYIIRRGAGSPVLGAPGTGRTSSRPGRRPWSPTRASARARSRPKRAQGEGEAEYATATSGAAPEPRERRASAPPPPPRQRRKKKRSGRRQMSDGRRREHASRSCSRRWSTALGLEGRGRGRPRRRRRDRHASTARTSACSSAATGRRSTPCSTSPTGSCCPWRRRPPATCGSSSTPRATASAAQRRCSDRPTRRPRTRAASDARSRSTR